MMDVKTQLLRLGAHLDDSVPRITDDELSRRIAAIEIAAYRHEPRQRRAVIVLIAAVAALVLVGAVPFLLGLTRIDDSPPATEPSPATLATSSPPTTTASVAPTAAPAPAGNSSPFDYAAAGEPAGTVETEVGNLEFYALTSVPYQWIADYGFPMPGDRRPDQQFRTIWGNADSGLEIFETEAGYLGLGSTAEPDEPRIMTGYLGNLFRVRGVGTQGEFEDAFHHGAEGVSIEYWGDDTGTWDGFYFAPLEVWFSVDGVAWEQTAALPFGPDVVMASQPRSVAEHDGTWMLLGWSGSADPAELAEPAGTTAAVPVVWASTNLQTWAPVPFDFGAPGWDTNLESVVASDDGWLVVGKRTSHETPRRYDSVVWFSVDGVSWVELPMAELVGLPQCGPFEPSEPCLHTFQPEFVQGGIGFYVWHDAPTGWGWTLWVGIWDE